MIQMVTPKAKLTRDFLEVGAGILGLDPRSRLSTLIELFRSNFKYSPSRCAFLFLSIVNHPVIPNEYEPKHLLWTLYFLLTYATERRTCCCLKADRKTIRKYTWPTITALASLSHQYVSFMCRSTDKRVILLIIVRMACQDSLGEQIDR